MATRTTNLDLPYARPSNDIRDVHNELLIALDAAIGISGATITTQGTLNIEDNTFYLQIQSSNPIINFDTLDYFEYLRSVNELRLNIGGSLALRVNASGINCDHTGGFFVVPGSDTDVTVLTVSVTGSPTLTWDESEDEFVFSKGLAVTDTTLLHTNTSLTDGAGASTGTLTNAPAATNPTKWIPIDDNGTTRYIPAW